MKRIKIAFLAILLVFSALWFMADTLLPDPLTYFSFRTVFVQYSGVLGIGMMSVAMMLALRPKWLEPHLDGLDKMYRLHKWLGMGALIVSILHWWWAQGSKWMVGWGWLDRPTRKAGPSESLGQLESWLREQRSLAESVGEWAFYAAVVLIALALIKRFPYHLFAKTHKWLAAAYLLLAYHSVVLTKADYWEQPIGWLLAASLLGGCVASILSLTGRIGATRKVQGTIARVTNYPALRVTASEIELENGWPGHSAGQFAFVTSDKREGPHPYTIASSWNPAERHLVFITKALGDHTGRLQQRLRVGLSVTVEGPYGCFDFEDTQPRQIWIGAGIGITPFVARLKYRAMIPDAKKIDLFHSTAEFDQDAINHLASDAAAADVRLHLLVDSRDGRLNGERIRASVPDWESASFWFCGPPGFGQSLRKDFLAHGLPPERFHQELFQMR